MQPRSHEDTKNTLDSERSVLDDPLNATYLRVLVIEAAVILLLFAFGMMFR